MRRSPFRRICASTPYSPWKRNSALQVTSPFCTDQRGSPGLGRHLGAGLCVQRRSRQAWRQCRRTQGQDESHPGIVLHAITPTCGSHGGSVLGPLGGQGVILMAVWGPFGIMSTLYTRSISLVSGFRSACVTTSLNSGSSPLAFTRLSRSSRDGYPRM